MENFSCPGSSEGQEELGGPAQIAFSHAQIGQTVLETRMRMRMPNPEQLAANSISSSSIALRHIARNSTPTPISTPFPSIRIGIAFQYINIYTQANLCTAELTLHCEISLNDKGSNSPGNGVIFFTVQVLLK